MEKFNSSLIDRLNLMKEKADEVIGSENSPIMKCQAAMNLLLSQNGANDTDALVETELTRLLVSIFTEAARLNLSSDGLKEILSSEADKSGLIPAILDEYVKHRDDLRKILEHLDWQYPQVFGIDWNILSVVESNVDVEIEEPLAEIILKTNSARGPGEFRFICNKNQLQDFHWKVKEALNFVERFANMKK